MKQFTSREFIKIVKLNCYFYNSSNGDHDIFINDSGDHISIPNHLKCVIDRRLIKENNLITDTKLLKKMNKILIKNEL
jgi:predicted RNA binding protein YcfA (HicA-like mRNA interferase family)